MFVCNLRQRITWVQIKDQTTHVLKGVLLVMRKEIPFPPFIGLRFDKDMGDDELGPVEGIWWDFAANEFHIDIEGYDNQFASTVAYRRHLFNKKNAGFCLQIFPLVFLSKEDAEKGKTDEEDEVLWFQDQWISLSKEDAELFRLFGDSILIDPAASNEPEDPALS
jgi:hypothetical protein